MIQTLVQILIMAIVLGLVWWALTQLMAAFTVPQPVRTVVLVLYVLVVVLWLLQLVGVVPRLLTVP